MLSDKAGATGANRSRYSEYPPTPLQAETNAIKYTFIMLSFVGKIHIRRDSVAFRIGETRYAD